ncbi:hypothetical protein DL767_009791 [Monosporascus sp. MG133]|nr:hypothetical protein DL767_009791 [Monosporascus sp. MG133]
MNSVMVGLVMFVATGTIAFCLLLRRLAHSRSASSPPARCGPRLECPAPDGPPQSPPQTKGVSLCQVYPPQESETATDIDIIAIHGLDTKSPDTWIWRPNGVNWLADQDMLPERFPTARIFTCDWPADLFERPDLIQKTIEEFARLLLAGIKGRPSVTNGHLGKDDRPIVFIASCLGGIVLMKALVMASSEYLSVRRATRGIVFLATPFRGTSFQDVAEWAEPGLRVWASIRDKNVSNLLEHAKSTFELGELVRSFTALCRENDLIDRVFTFYETGKSSLPRKIAPWLPASLSQEQPLVDQLSATPDFILHPLPLDRPHVLMNKFCGPDDPGYVSIAGIMEILLCEVRNGQPVEKADVWIRNKCYSLKNLEIERLSGDLLPMDRCYINLAIIEQPSDSAGRSKEGDTTQQSSPFSLLARLKVETPAKEIEVTLPNLFEPRKTRDGQTRRPSRILIRGRAGVGKTTLCKKIVYEFTHGTMWRDLFDRVLWVPLRNLKREERRLMAGYNFGNLFRHEYFSQHPEQEKLAQALWHALKDAKSGRTLFILDGLDEVSQDLVDDMFGFLKELLNQPNVVITSRPHALLPLGLDPLHFELETVGFYPDQVRAYVEKAFTDPETGKTDPEKPGTIQSYLQAHQLIEGLVRIPVQLDALCYTWDGFGNKLIPQTMTAIYKAIEERLWKKDVLRLEKLHDGQRLTQHHIENADLDNILDGEIYLLEGLAFTGLHNDVINFQSQHWKAVHKQFGFPSSNILPDKTLPRLSFLRTSDPSSEARSYHFLHLTFQEYFAARYFLLRPRSKIKIGISEKQQSKRFDANRRCQSSSFKLLRPGSKIKIGISEKQQLKCFKANRRYQSSSFKLLRPGSKIKTRMLEKKQSKRFKASRRYQSSSFKLLRPGSNIKIQQLLQAIAARLEDQDWQVRIAAVKTLQGQPALSEQLLQAIAARLEHQDS